LTTFKLEGLSDGDIANLVGEKFDAPEIQTFVEKIPQRSPWYSQQGPPKPPDWVRRWTQQYAAWKMRNGKQLDVVSIGCGERI